MIDKESRIDQHLNNLRALQASSGLFFASPRGVSTGYDKAWLRDNVYEALAFSAVGDFATVQKVYRAILDVLLKHEDKIKWAQDHKPDFAWQYIHARYNPETFEEFWEEWGNKQNDAIGAILFHVGSLEEHGEKIIETDADRRIIQRLVYYLASVEYWHDPDAGMWEENEEVHASSVGACLAGLKAVAKLSDIEVSPELIANGVEALAKLLPRESASKFADLSQMSLIWPYRIIAPEMAYEILENVAYHLEKKRGVIRYKMDRYYNKNVDGWSEEAEWCFGLSWLALCWNALGDKEKAKHYLGRAGEVVTQDGKVPELYFSNSDKPNGNVPLGWSESMYVVALKSIN